MTAKRLELGSGYAPTPGYMHLDINPTAPHVDFVGFAHPLPREVIDAGPWDEIRAVDVLEHLSYRVARDAFYGWVDALALNGLLYVQVPDAGQIMREYVERKDAERGWNAEGQQCSALLGAQWRLLGGHDDGQYVRAGDDWRWNAHYSLWDQDSLLYLCALKGLKVERIRVNEHPNICLWARR